MWRRLGLERLLQRAGIPGWGLACRHRRLHNDEGSNDASGGGVGTDTSRPNGIHRGLERAGGGHQTSGPKIAPQPSRTTGLKRKLETPETERASSPDAKSRIAVPDRKFLAPWASTLEGTRTRRCSRHPPHERFPGFKLTERRVLLSLVVRPRQAVRNLRRRLPLQYSGVPW